MKVENDSLEYKYFNEFLKDYGHLKPYRTEWMVYDKELRLAGSIDMIFKNKDGSLRIYDWKRCKEIKKDNKWQSAKTSCISHLPDTNFWHYALQLNTYKYLLEKNYGKKISEMCLVCMHPDNKKHLIPAGTPICQVIPFRREVWKAEYTWTEQEQLDRQKAERVKITEDRLDWYKNYAHQKKKYV